MIRLLLVTLAAVALAVGFADDNGDRPVSTDDLQVEVKHLIGFGDDALRQETKAALLYCHELSGDLWVCPRADIGFVWPAAGETAELSTDLTVQLELDLPTFTIFAEAGLSIGGHEFAGAWIGAGARFGIPLR